jgi:transcriptional regulator with XRE-family HTH domain
MNHIHVGGKAMPRRQKASALTAAIGQRLRMLRNEQGVTLAHFSAGTGKGHLSSVEHGLVNPSVTVLDRIAQSTGIEMPYLVCLPNASDRQALIERTRFLSDDEVTMLLGFLGPVPVPAETATHDRNNLGKENHLCLDDQRRIRF